MKFKVSQREQRRFETAVLRKSKEIVIAAMDKLDEFMFNEAERLATALVNTDEFRRLQTPVLVGKFGFTPSEVSRLGEVANVVARDRSVTMVNKRLRGNRPKVELRWVDFDELRQHPVGDHPLTRLNPETLRFEDTGTVVSWIEWWEEGVTIRGHVFNPGNRRALQFSRSGRGIMQASAGSLFMIEPTRVFEKVAEAEGRKTRDGLEQALRSVVARR